MKLSDAIRLGAMLRPQDYGELTGIGSCVLQAAAEAIGSYPTYGVALERWDWITTEVGAPLCCPSGCGTISQSPQWMMASHLNDYHHWTRERIADWVASIEPQEAPAPAEQEAVHERVA